MSNDLLEQVLNSESVRIAVDYASKAKEHPVGTTIGVLGLLGAHAIYKSLKRARMLSYLEGPQSQSLVWGHGPKLTDVVNGAEMQVELLKIYGPLCRVKGVLGEDRLWVADPHAMHEIIVREFNSLHNSEEFLSVATGNGNLTVNGQKHKFQRKLLNPIFTPSYMRNLVTIFGAITNRLEDIVMSKVQEGGGSSAAVDIYKRMNNVGLEMIGQAGVGHSFGIMEGKETSSDYLEAAGLFFPVTFQLWYIRPILPLLAKIGPDSFRRFVVEHTPLRLVQELKRVSDVMYDMAVGVYSHEKAEAANGTLDAQVAAGKGIMTSLLKQNEVVPPSEQMSEEELVAQVK